MVESMASAVDVSRFRAPHAPHVPAGPSSPADGSHGSGRELPARTLLQRAKQGVADDVLATMRNIRSLCDDPNAVVHGWRSAPESLGVQLRPRRNEIHALLLAAAEAGTVPGIRLSVQQVYRAIFGDACLGDIEKRATQALLGDLRVILSEPPSDRPRTSGGVPRELTGALGALETRLIIMLPDVYA